MMFGFQMKVFEDVKSRKILYDKKSMMGYLLPDKGEGKVQLLKMNIFNSAAISFIVGYFLNFPIYLYFVVGVALYFAYIFYFNRMFLPTLQKVKKFEQKKVQAKNENGPFPFIALGYLAVGVGLIYCLFTNQVEVGVMTYVVYGGIIICFVNVAYYFANYMKRGK